MVPGLPLPNSTRLLLQVRPKITRPCMAGAGMGSGS
jgi:hypothetical protein